MKARVSSQNGEAIVLYANYAAFASGQAVKNPKVQSRMLLWCESGKGEIRVNGTARPFGAGDFVFLPWNHRIEYKADEAEPYLLAGIHMVPRLKPGAKIEYMIFHKDMGSLPAYLERSDAELPGLPVNETMEGSLLGQGALAALARYIVEWFLVEPREEAMARRLGASLVYELARARCRGVSTGKGRPLELKRVLFHIDSNLDGRIELEHLAKLAGVSRSSLFRLFRAHLGESPANWILRRKMEHAASLLARSSLRIGEIGAKVGIDDPYYFSRAFKKIHGMSARDYRARRALLPL